MAVTGLEGGWLTVRRHDVNSFKRDRSSTPAL
jgi:hypothetical protein